MHDLPPAAVVKNLTREIAHIVTGDSQQSLKKRSVIFNIIKYSFMFSKNKQFFWYDEERLDQRAK